MGGGQEPEVEEIPEITSRSTSFTQSKLAHMERPDHEVPHVALAVLEAHAAGLIALTAGGEGAVVCLEAGASGRLFGRALDELTRASGRNS